MKKKIIRWFFSLLSLKLWFPWKNIIFLLLWFDCLMFLPFQTTLFMCIVISLFWNLSARLNVLLETWLSRIGEGIKIVFSIKKKNKEKKIYTATLSGDDDDDEVCETRH